MNTIRVGVVDMLNNKMCDLQRHACGYQDEDYLTRKIVVAFLSPRTRNEGKDPL